MKPESVRRWTGPVMALLILTAPSCASSGAPNVQRDVVTVTLPTTGAQIMVEVDRDDPTLAEAIHATPDEVWSALRSVYEALGIGVTYVDETRKRLGAEDWRTDSIADQRLSRWVDCGSGLGGRYADVWQVRLNIGSLVQAAAGGAQIFTRIDGYARSMDGSGGGDQHCTSNGKLEAVIADATRQVLARRSTGG